MQLSFGLSLKGQNIYNNIYSLRPKESNACIALCGPVLGHIIQSAELSDLEKIFYILVNTLSVANLHGGNQRAIALSAESWAKRLNCAKSQVFAMQNSLEAKGYFIISRDRNKHGQNKRNLICPTLPDEVFKQLSQNAESRVGREELYFLPHYESKLQFLDRTKLFIIIGYQVLKDIFSCEHLSAFNKLLWLDFYTICYKSHVTNFGSISFSDSLGFSFVTSYKQLEDRHSCDKRMLSKALIDLEELGLIKRERFHTKKEQGDQERQDKSLWKISLVLSDYINPENSPEGTPEFGSGAFVPGSNFIRNSNINAISKPSFGRANSIGVPSHIGIDGKGNNSDRAFSNRVGESNGPEDTNFSYIDEVVAELGTADNFVNSLNLEACKENEKNEATTFLNFFAPSDPEFLSTSLYYKKDNKTNIFKSNIVNDAKHKKLDWVKFSREASTNNITSNIYCLETTKLWSKMRVGGEGRHISNVDSAFRSKNFKGEIMRKPPEFNVGSLLIKAKLKLLTKDKADKARKFAYSLFSKKITKGYASTLSKNELAKQLIFHASSWKPTKVGSGASDDKLVDVALSVAWKAAVNGSWQQPLEWAKAKELHYEFLIYKKKFKESGIISHELRSLESMINNLLGAKYDLATIITREVGVSVKEVTKIEEIKEKGMAEISDICKNGTATFRETMDGSAQLKQDALHVLTLTDRNYQKINNATENKTEQSLSCHSHNNQDVNRAGRDHTFQDGRDSTLIPNLSSTLDSFQNNIFLEYGPKTASLNSISTMNNLSTDSQEHLVFFNLLKNNTDICQEKSTDDNYQRYITKLKFFEINNKGELVITLHTDDQFIHSSFLAKVDPLVAHADKSIFKSESGNDIEIIEGQENVLYASDQHLSKEFIKIDKALNGILKNLKRGK